jgi:hypothetical protein
MAGAHRLVFPLFLLLLGGVRCQPTRYSVSSDLARRTTALLSAHDTATLVNLFHIPAAYSAQEREQEFRTLHSLLEIVYDELGPPVTFGFLQFQPRP